MRWVTDPSRRFYDQSAEQARNFGELSGLYVHGTYSFGVGDVCCVADSLCCFFVVVKSAASRWDLLLAVTLNAGIKGKSLWRIIYFLPMVTSSAVLTLIFMWIYNTNGLLNRFLAAIALPTY